MSDIIGTTAGMVWNYLKKNGSASSTQIQKGIKADAATTNQAIGWLAREGKLKAQRGAKATTYQLEE